VKEFWVYTGLRAVVFLATLLVVVGVWLLVADQVPLLWAVVLAFVISGIGSFFLLQRSREAFARRVQERADRAAVALESRRSREDAD
jgi:ABC-type bacteriocin/lantibiotic exporter with double-glycine peptidase domain